MELNNEKFGNFIKQLRNEKKLTQKELGEKLNITDKAISKWERGLSFPDIEMLTSLSDYFEVDIAELLKGERGESQEIDIEKAVKEAVEKLEKEKKKKRKIKKITIGIVSSIILILSIILQVIYYQIIKPKNYEYISDSLEYIINQIIIITTAINCILWIKKLAILRKIIIAGATIFTIINIAYWTNNGLQTKSIISFSKDFSNQVVLKMNRKTGAITLYKTPKFVLFAQKREQLYYEGTGKIKKDWLTNDICAITYLDKEEKIREFVVTYGDRSDGLSYYYVTGTIGGEWNGKSTQILVDSKGIKITKNGKEEQFSYEDTKQFGTIAVVLYEDTIPKYVIALDENCKVDSPDYIVKQGGNIILYEVSMKKTAPKSLYRVTSRANLVNLGEEEYQIKNGILYLSYDGKETIEVPGDFSEITDAYKKGEYLISKEKTMFYYTKYPKIYLVYSDNMGSTWETVEFASKGAINNIQFLNSDVGYMLHLEDFAMGTALGSIKKTTDGGKTWQEISKRN